MPAKGLVWLASYPKSGNTWFRIVFANLKAGDHGPVDINDLDLYGGIASDRSDFERETLLESSLLSPDDIDLLRPCVYRQMARESAERQWMKVHDAYTRLPGGEPLFGNAASAVVYLVRDPRDVAISFAHHYDVTIDTAIARMNRPGWNLGEAAKGRASSQLRQKLTGWSGHAASWLDQRDVPLHLLRYEDLLADPVSRFRAALAFAGEEFALPDIRRAVARSDFATLRQHERRTGFVERMSKAPFFRSGSAGGWREVLSAEQRARLEDDHGPMMERLGYGRG